MPILPLFLFSLLLFLPIPSAAHCSVHLDAGYGEVPLSFVLNEGQFDPGLRFMAEGNDKNNLQFAEHIDISPRPDNFEPYGAGILCLYLYQHNGDPVVTGEDPFPWKSNYYFSSDSSQWRTDVTNYRIVRVHDLYPGIDARFTAQGREYIRELVVRPGADPGRIIFEHGYTTQYLELTGDGVIMRRMSGEFSGILYSLYAPPAYQIIKGEKIPVETRYRMVDEANSLVGYAFGEYDHSKDLIIAPEEIYTSHMGRRYVHSAGSLDVDSGGNMYLTGVMEYDIPWSYTAGFRSGGYVMKILPGGKDLGYVSYYKNTLDDGYDAPVNILVDHRNGNVYICGGINDTSFPVTTDAWKKTCEHGVNGFLLKLDASGHLSYATYLGYIADGQISGMELDRDGFLYMAGSTTTSTLFHTVLFGDDPKGCWGLLMKMDTADNRMVYSDLFADVRFFDIGINHVGDVFAAGSISGPAQFSFHAPLDSTHHGKDDAFILQVSADGETIVRATFLGGTGDDFARSIAFDSQDNILVCGYTSSPDFPVTPGAYDTSFNTPDESKSDAFVTKLSADLGMVLFSTFIGGDQNDGCHNIYTDSRDNILVAGETQSIGFTDSNPYFSGWCAFVLKLTPAGDAVMYSSAVGPRQLRCTKPAPDGSVYFCGTGSGSSRIFSESILDTNHPRSAYGGSSSGYILKYIDDTALAVAEPESPSFFTLFPPYPNPFNASVTIPFSLPRSTVVRVEIRDVLGRKVTELISGTLSAGAHALRWDAGAYSSGVYFCVLRAGDASQTRRVLLLK